MIAENKQREYLSQSTAYDERAFFKIAQDFKDLAIEIKKVR